MRRRVVTQIRDYLSPRQMFKLIHRKEWPYSVFRQKEYACRDRAMMSTCFVSAGRISAIVGGPKTKGRKVVGRHPGLLCSNLEVKTKYILVKNMPIVKRSAKLIKKYGLAITKRDDFVIPLETGLFNVAFWDQLVPFGWLLYEYLAKYSSRKGKIWPYEDTRAYQIIRHITDKYPHWFRAQAEQFYGHFILRDTVRLSKFVGVVDPKQVKHYIGYSWRGELKDQQDSMDFTWIPKAVAAIKDRLKQTQ